ncbi:MAG: sugar nucleotide-binding protein [Bdellovibrionales bacterium]|nr:sugar nucleotide-binding protein [Bdellovibrionales bacterium]
MKPRSVLIVGGSGFVGTHLAIRLRDELKVFTTDFRQPKRIRGVTSLAMPLLKPDEIKNTVLMTQADVVVYAAGSGSSKSSQEIEAINSSGALSVLAAASLLGSKFIYLSSAQVFDGAKGGYREVDAPVPADDLGKAKLAAENGIRTRGLNYLILRSSPVYGLGPASKPSITDRVLSDLCLGNPVELDDREVHSFAPVESLVEFIARSCVTEGARGILHHGGGEPCTLLELGRQLAQRFKLSPSLLRPKKSDGSGDPGKRDLTLNSSVAADLLKMQPLLLEQGFNLLEKQLLTARS